MKKIKDFLYLDTSLVNSLFSQYYQGIITSMSTGSTDKTKLDAGLGFDLKLVKGSKGGSAGAELTKSETIDLHHYAYEMLEKQLIDDGMIDAKKKDIVMISGNLRIIDSAKTIESFDGLKSLVTGFDAVMKLSPNPSESAIIPRDLRDAARNSKDISKLLSQLSNNGIFAYVDGERIALDRTYLVSSNSPEFANNGKLFEGNYVVIGLNSNFSINDTQDDNGDMLLILSKAFAGIQDIMKVSTIKPIAIYRLVEHDN